MSYKFFNLGLPDICKGDCSDHHLYDGDGAAWKGEGDKSLMICQYNNREVTKGPVN